jgi:hypothetical protein
VKGRGGDMMGCEMGVTDVLGLGPGPGPVQWHSNSILRFDHGGRTL